MRIEFRSFQVPVYAFGKLQGFVQHTKGGLWRAYSYGRHCGVGPFPSILTAMQWVTTGSCSFLGTIYESRVA